MCMIMTITTMVTPPPITYQVDVVIKTYNDKWYNNNYNDLYELNKLDLEFIL